MEIRTATLAYLGVNAIENLEPCLSDYVSRGYRRAGIITGKDSYRKSGAWQRVYPVLESVGLQYLHFDRVEPNPTTEIIDEGYRFFKDFRPQVLLAIGGGSVIDTTKALAVMLFESKGSVRDLFLKKWTPVGALPIVALNLTHGTGSEVDRYAVATVEDINYKGSIAFRFLYPEYAIDDPSFTVTLSETQTRYTSIDAFCHLIESSTTKKASPYTVMLAREGITKVVQWLPVALKEPDNLEARQWLLYASLLGGLGIDSGIVHLVHPMEHLLSAINPSLPHGLGLALLLPPVVEAVYPSVSDVLSEVLSPIVKGLKGVPEESTYVRDALWDWLFSIGFNETLLDYGFTPDMVPSLVQKLFSLYGEGSSLWLAPVDITEDTIMTIYRTSIEKSFQK